MVSDADGQIQHAGTGIDCSACPGSSPVDPGPVSCLPIDFTETARIRFLIGRIAFRRFEGIVFSQVYHHTFFAELGDLSSSYPGNGFIVGYLLQ